MNAVKTTGALLLLLGLAGCAAIPPVTPRPTPTPGRLQPHTTQAGDMITADFRTDNFVIWIESEKGIGKANFERRDAAPASVTFHLRLKGLEQFTLTWGDRTATVNYPSSGGPPVTPDPADPLAMPVTIEAATPTIPLQDGYFVVTAPAQFIQDAPERFMIQWIDFYR